MSDQAEPKFNPRDIIVDDEDDDKKYMGTVADVQPGFRCYIYQYTCTHSTDKLKGSVVPNSRQSTQCYLQRLGQTPSGSGSTHIPNLELSIDWRKLAERQMNLGREENPSGRRKALKLRRSPSRDGGNSLTVGMKGLEIW